MLSIPFQPKKDLTQLVTNPPNLVEHYFLLNPELSFLVPLCSLFFWPCLFPESFFPMIFWSGSCARLQALKIGSARGPEPGMLRFCWLGLENGGELVPSGNLLHSYWKWPFIVDFPIENGWIFYSYVRNYQRVPPICGHVSRKQRNMMMRTRGCGWILGFTYGFTVAICSLLSDKPDWYFLSTQKLGDSFNPTYILMKLVAALDEKNIWRCPFHLQDWSMRRTMVSCKISLQPIHWRKNMVRSWRAKVHSLPWD